MPQWVWVLIGAVFIIMNFSIYAGQQAGLFNNNASAPFTFYQSIIMSIGFMVTGGFVGFFYTFIGLGVFFVLGLLPCVTETIKLRRWYKKHPEYIWRFMSE
ncbi:TPA: hypothetical protein ACNV5N_001054 [Citrobacter freundii]